MEELEQLGREGHADYVYMPSMTRRKQQAKLVFQRPCSGDYSCGQACNGHSKANLEMSNAESFAPDRQGGEGPRVSAHDRLGNQNSLPKSMELNR